MPARTEHGAGTAPLGMEVHPRRPAPLAGTVGLDSVAEWARPLTGVALGFLLFETLTGLAITLLPFSVLNQFAVLLHTALGLLSTPVIGVYLWRHWRCRYRGKFNHYQLLGYFAALSFGVLLVSGLALTWEALFAVRVSTTWVAVHVVSTFIFIAAMIAHLGTLLWRRSNNAEARRRLRAARRVCAAWTLGVTATALAACAGLALTYRVPRLDRSFPSDYSFKYGVDRPFAPSLARKDLSVIKQHLTEGILAVLDGPQRESFVAGFHMDPARHEGWVSVTQRLCGEMVLRRDQRSAIDELIATAFRRIREDGRIHSRELAGSAGCGTSGCHTEILAEWEPSAHRYASMDFVFQEVQANMARELAPEATRYCAGCHDPIALFSGAKNVGNLTLSAEGADEGISCLVCHTTIQTDVRGNADYTVRPGARYIYELHDGALAKGISDFLIRAYPRQHVASYARPLYKTAEACGACHKQFIDEELNEVGFVQGQNQYDSWRKSRWHADGDPVRTIGCRECHMPLVDSNDPATGDRDDPNRTPDDGKHRSHRFLGANQFVPRHHQLPGAEQHCALTVQWLRGEIDIPEIADRWTSGPVIRLELAAPTLVRPGEEVTIQTILTNNKTGHDFPTGPLDMIEAWVEVQVTDATGAVVFESARTDEAGYVVDPQIIFKSEPINRAGELVGKHELWEKVGSRFRRALFPGFTDTTAFTFQCPGMPASQDQQARLDPVGHQDFQVPESVAGDRLTVRATLWYCKFSAPFLDRLFGPDAGRRSEVTAMAHAEQVIEVTHGP